MVRDAEVGELLVREDDVAGAEAELRGLPQILLVVVEVADLARARRAADGAREPVWKSTTGLGGPHQTSELSISIKS